MTASCSARPAASPAPGRSRPSRCSPPAATSPPLDGPPPAATSAPAPRAAITTPWCGAGWQAIDGATCVALPEHFAHPASLVVFAHGILAPGALPPDDQATLLAAARAHGFAVLFARGKAGLCGWEPKVADHFCWPTTQQTADEVGPGILAEWAEAQARAEEIAGVRFERRYFFGFCRPPGARARAPRGRPRSRVGHLGARRALIAGR